MDLTLEGDWRTTLGYLPVPLKGRSMDGRFVMLNGAHGNFCLDLHESHTELKDRRDVAWSVDVDHYVRIHGNQVEVSRWDRSEVLRSSTADVVNNLEAFQNHLQTAKAPRDRSVVAHALGVYHRIRSMLPDGSSGLEAFLYMLHDASLFDATGVVGVDPAWPDLERCEEAWRRLSATARDRISADLLAPRSEDKRPSIPLVIRHAMGRIFQEAHNLVMLSPQMSLLDEREVVVTGKATRFSGAYFTPTPLVRTLVEQCITHEILARPQLTILDPACGSGEFLRECVRQLSLHAYTGRLHIVGFDVSLPAVLMARFALAQETSGLANANVTIKHCDALATAWPENVDICLMNPPYASWRSLPLEAREILGRTLKELAGARPDLAFAFLLHGVECLGVGGLLGAVVPASILDGDSAKPLRARLDEIAAKRMLVRLGNQSIFAEATVDVCLYVCSKVTAEMQEAGTPRDRLLMIWADHSPESSDSALRALRSLDWQPAFGDVEIEHTGFSIYTNPSAAAHGWAPRPLSSVRMLRRLERLPSLDKIYDIKQGTITGLNEAFLLSEEEFRRLPRNERSFFRKAIVNASIRDGRIYAGRRVFYPYGEDCDRLDSEADLLQRVPRYAESFLLPNKAGLQARAGIIDQASWWQLTRKRDAFVGKKPKIVSTYFGDAGSFAWDEKGEYVVVQGYIWEPRHPGMATTEIGHAVVAVMSSSIARKLIAAVSNSLAGGQFNLSKRFLSKMPFVDLADKRLAKQVTNMAVMGAALGRGDAIDVELLDRLAEDLFLIAGDLLT